MKVKELFEKRLLRKIPVDNEKVKKSLKLAAKNLQDGKDIEKTNNLNFAILAAYMSMFHAARALLYKEGVQEKSHFAVFIYLKEEHSKQIGDDLVFEFNNAREQRHESLYGLESEFNIKDTNHIIKVAKQFLKKIRNIITTSNT